MLRPTAVMLGRFAPMIRTRNFTASSPTAFALSPDSKMNGHNLGRYAIEPVRPGFIPSLRQPTPQVLWIGCSDSSEDETTALGLDPGETIVLRNLGNMIIDEDLSSSTMLRYAVDHLDVKHIVVCGHYGCNLVKATSHAGLKDPWLSILDTLQTRHKSEMDRLVSQEQDRCMVLLNIMEQARSICRDDAVAEAVRKQELTVHTLLYDDDHNRICRIVDTSQSESL